MNQKGLPRPLRHDLHRRRREASQQAGWIAPVIMIVVLLVGLVVGLQLIKQTNIFKSKASLEPITYSGPSVHADTDGTQYISSNEVIIDLFSPFGPPQSKVLGVSSAKSPFWEEFINTFLISLHLKKAPDQQPADKPIEAVILVSNPLTPSSTAVFPTVQPSVEPVNTKSSNLSDATIGFKVAESPTELENKQFLAYSSYPIHLHYVFSSNSPGIKTIFAQFKSVKGNLSEVFAKSIELRSLSSPVPSASAIVTPSASPFTSSSTKPSQNTIGGQGL